MNQTETTAKIKFSESEIDKLIWALTIVKTIRLPIKPDWKVPYKALLKDLQAIKEKINNGSEHEDKVTPQRFYGSSKEAD